MTRVAYLSFSHFASSFYSELYFFSNFGNLLFHTKVENTKQEVNDSLVWLRQPHLLSEVVRTYPGDYGNMNDGSHLPSPHYGADSFLSPLPVL